MSSDAAIYAEIKRLDQLRSADQTAVAAALSAAEKAVAAALAASEKAVSKAETAQQRVNEGQNEFRGTLKDQAATLMPRTETESIVRELRGLIETQATSVANMRSRLDVGPPSLGALQAESDSRRGRDSGSGDTWRLVLGLGGIGLTILGIVVGRML